MADQAPTALKIDTNNEPPSPPIAAIFWVNFDHRKGYVLGWHRTLDNVQVEGVVEFKSLPSGLHNVEEDLVYFIHDDYAGLSAFINSPDDQSDRATRMLAIGILVPLEQGRMGRSWRHAEALKEFARAQIENPTETTPLEEYWDKHKLNPDEHASKSPEDDGEDETPAPSNGYSKSRKMSAATTFISSPHSLTPHHPALTLIDAIKVFGPLIFPLYRAALLRKRILIVSDTPVEFVCNLVYNLSILSSVSRSLLSIIPEAVTSDARLRPLFTIGVMDIPHLKQAKEADMNSGFIACTTDDVLASKPDLYDILVLMPKSEVTNGASKVFPQLVISSPELSKAFPKSGIRATQRDSKRFSHLVQDLRRPGTREEAVVDVETSSLSSHTSSYSTHKAVIEPASWSRVAYTSLVWWASSGDTRVGFEEIEENERERDQALLHEDAEGAPTREVAVVAYFHRMTATIIQTIADAVARADGLTQTGEPYHDDENDNADTQHNNESGQEEQEALLDRSDEPADVEVNHEDMVEMGLDSWSASDKRFVEEFVELWWHRKAVIRPLSIECCGLRIL